MIYKLFERVSNLLDQNNIPYMLTGSLALNVYTIPRMSLDIDIVIELATDNVPDFITIFDEHYYLNQKTIKEEVKRKGMFNVIDHETGFKIDFIVKKDTEYRRNEFQRRRKDSLAGITVWIVSPEDLVISKFNWIQKLKSEKQLNDIENILSIENIDRDYILNWCKKLKMNTFNLL